ncbi:UNVERIFIED_CONTAM: hypothetical protein NCL1_39891 [Trichonephila clavipes]
MFRASVRRQDSLFATVGKNAKWNGNNANISKKSFSKFFTSEMIEWRKMLKMEDLSRVLYSVLGLSD